MIGSCPTAAVSGRRTIELCRLTPPRSGTLCANLPVVPTASDFATLVRCAHRIHLDATGDPAERVPASDFLQFLWEEGRLHEDAVIAEMDVTPVSRGLTPPERVAETVKLMRLGVPFIYHGYLEHQGLRGEPDLLERVEVPSPLGSFSYLPVDIKSARAFEDEAGTRPKRRYLMQLCAYAELLEAHQGRRPVAGKIIDRDGATQSLDLARAWPDYLAVRAQLQGILSGEEATRPGWKGACAYCAWQDRCWEELVASDDLTTVAGLGEGTRQKLLPVGVTTATELAGADAGTLVAANGIGQKTAQTLTRQAKAQKAGKPALLAPWVPPAAEFEVSYDVEDFAPGPFVYLHGLLIRKTGARRFGEAGFTDADWGSFEPVCAELPETEEAVWQRFLERVRTLERRGEYRVYVYSHHEKTMLKQLAETYGGSAELNAFIERFVDLLQVVRNHVVFPTDGRGLKALARFIGFEWRDQDPGGAQSMAWWAEYEKEPAANRRLRDRIIAYNEDDLRATFALRDWLERFARGEVRTE